MIFSADASSSNNYYYERKSQAFLTNSTSVWFKYVLQECC
jgi:hypothetical protein